MKVFIRNLTNTVLRYYIVMGNIRWHVSYSGVAYFIDAPEREEINNGEYLHIMDPLLQRITVNGTAEVMKFKVGFYPDLPKPEIVDVPVQTL